MSTAGNSVERAARALIGAHRSGGQVSADAAFAPRSAEDAYRIQDRVLAELHPGVRVSAWKAGSSHPDIEPTAAPIAGSRLHQSPASLPARGFRIIGVEAEIAFRLSRDLPPREQSYCEYEVADALAEAFVAIELCDSRLADWHDADPLWKLADFQMNAALVLGDGRRDWRNIDFAAQPVELLVDGARRASRRGSHPLGNPFLLLPWAAAHVARRSGGLRAGDVVTTGSWTGMEFVLPGAQVVARFPGIGEASVRLAV
ncbi:MAG: fumarylacetoacetate hydrolase family protein [Betaproteobacteria bacterium]|nr:fumarylacetoacetate hydrolase family protein [Betaproteobacteria bacterium]